MRTATIATLATVVLALLIVAMVGLNEATGNPTQSTMSIYALDAGANMKNLPVQEIPLP